MSNGRPFRRNSMGPGVTVLERKLEDQQHAIAKLRKQLADSKDKTERTEVSLARSERTQRRHLLELMYVRKVVQVFSSYLMDDDLEESDRWVFDPVPSSTAELEASPVMRHMTISSGDLGEEESELVVDTTWAVGEFGQIRLGPGSYDADDLAAIMSAERVLASYGVTIVNANPSLPINTRDIDV